MKVKHLLLILLSVILVFNTIPSFADENSLTDRRHALFNVSSSGFKTENLTVSSSGFDVQEIDGEYYAVSRGSGNDNLFLNISDKYWFSENASCAAVVVEYLDKGFCTFSIHYNSEEGDILEFRDVTKMQDTGELKREVIFLDDFTACNKADGGGCDIRLRTCGWNSGCSHRGAYIKSVEIIENAREYFVDVMAENGEIGRIFSYGSSDEMTFNVYNGLIHSVETSISWKVRNYENRVITSGNIDEFEAEPEGYTYKTFNTGILDCGFYVLEYDVTSKGTNGFSETYTRKLNFSVVRTMQEGDKRSSIFAVCSHYGNPQYSLKDVDVVQRIGVKAFRDEVYWYNVEKVPGEYVDSQKNFRDKLESYGIESVTLVNQSNTIYNGGRATNYYTYDEKALNAYGDVAAYISTLNDIAYVEILNEYNHSSHNGSDRNPKTYIQYCKAAYESIKKANPDAKVVIGNLAGYDISFMSKLFELGGFNYCDAVSVHPYQSGKFDQDLYRQQMNTLHRYMDEYDVDKEIILTEMGFSRAFDGKDGVPKEKRRVYAPEILLMSQGERLADMLCWYDLVDDGPFDNLRENRWGLLHFADSLNAHTASEAFVTIAAMTNLVQDAEPLGVIRKNGNKTIAYNFKRSDGKNVVSVWTTNDSDTIALNLGCEKAKMYNMYGTYLGDVYGVNGVFTLGLCDEVVYLEGDFAKFEEAVPVIGLAENAVTAIEGDLLFLNTFDILARNIDVDIDFDEQVFENRGDCTLKVKNGVQGTYHINVKITENGKLLYAGTVKVDIVAEPIKATVEVVKAYETDDTHWQAVLKMTNVSNMKYYAGECAIVSPMRYVDSIRRFSSLGPNETRIIKLNIPELIDKRPEDMVCEIRLNNGVTQEVKHKVDFTTAEYANIAPTLDGKISIGEWPGSILCEDREERVSQSTSKPWRGKDDLSLEMHLLWDEEYLYLATSVKDDSYYMNGNVMTMWNGDCMQIGILETVAGIETTSSAFTELALGEVGGEARIYVHSHVGGVSQIEVKDFKGVVARDKDTTIYEYAIPWSVLLGEGHIPNEGKTYGFSVCINDGDGEARHQWLNYNDGIGATKDATKFGKLTLLNKK